MKQIIIFLLVVIVGILGYNTYKKHQRFSLKAYEYTPPENLNFEGVEKSLQWDYFDAIEDVNGYIISQWSANGIDVRNPKKDNEVVNLAVSKYREKLARVKYFETLIKTDKPKQEKPISSNEEKKALILKSFQAIPSKTLKIGDKNAVVFEIQKILNAKGDSITVDGVYRSETANAVATFETQNNLFSDGILDEITLAYLLK